MGTWEILGVVLGVGNIAAFILIDDPKQSRIALLIGLACLFLAVT